VIQKMPFSSARKRMSMLLEVNGQKRLVVKGASEMVLSSCSQFQQFNGQILPLDGNLKKRVEDGIEEMAT